MNRAIAQLAHPEGRQPHALAVEVGFMGMGKPAIECLAKGPVHRARERRGRAVRNERAGPWPAVPEALALKLAVRLQHGVGIDREVLDDLARGWKAIARPKHVVADGVLHLLNELQICRDARPSVEVERDAAFFEFHYDPSGIAQELFARKPGGRASYC